MQNGYVERSNGRMRDELLKEALFLGLAHARAVIRARVNDYNTERPHSSLEYVTRRPFAAKNDTMAWTRPSHCVGCARAPQQHPVFGSGRLKAGGHITLFIVRHTDRTLSDVGGAPGPTGVAAEKFAAGTEGRCDVVGSL